jgi:hypothetical protein
MVFVWGYHGMIAATHGIVQSNYSKIIKDGLVLWLDAMNNNSYPESGTTWTDLSGNNNTGTLTNGPTFNTANGGTILFDGSNDYVTLPSLTLGNEITVMCFVRPQTTSIIQTILGNSAAGTNTNGIRLFFNPSGAQRTIVTEVGNGSTGDTTSTGVKIVFDTWQHITYVLNKNTTKLKIYYNGILEAEKTSTVNNYNTTGVLRIGTLIDGFPGFYILKGDISSYNIYTRELSPNEVLQNFNANRGRFGI